MELRAATIGEDTHMVRYLCVLPICLFCLGCQSVEDFLTRPPVECEIVFYSQAPQHLASVGFQTGSNFVGCGYLGAGGMKIMSFMTGPLKPCIVCRWVDKETKQEFERAFEFPQRYGRKFHGTIVFFFTDKGVTMEYDERDFRECRELYEKYNEMSGRFRNQRLGSRGANP